MDILLIAGDVVNDGKAEQYALALEAFDSFPAQIPVFAVSGNHDIPGNDETGFRAFERELLKRARGRYQVEADPCGAFRVKLSDGLDLIGLNPLYHQKMFRFPNKGEQLTWLEGHLEESGCPNHIVLCHPPLAAHNPQQVRPYLPTEQDRRLQQLIDSHPRVLFLSGHTHLTPEIEPEDEHGNIYINDGSICPTAVKGSQCPGPGNVMTFEAGDSFGNFRILLLKKGEQTRSAPTP